MSPEETITTKRNVLDELSTILASQLDVGDEIQSNRIYSDMKQLDNSSKKWSMAGKSEIIEINTLNNLIFCASVSDKFGDNGITAAGIILIKNNVAEIDSYMLSCRILRN